MAANYDLTIEQGATFSQLLTWLDENGDPVNLTGGSAISQLRNANDDELIELSTANSRILLGGSLGTIQLVIAASDTAALASGSYFWDIFITVGSTVTRLLQGGAIVQPRITQ